MVGKIFWTKKRLTKTQHDILALQDQASCGSAGHEFRFDSFDGFDVKFKCCRCGQSYKRELLMTYDRGVVIYRLTTPERKLILDGLGLNKKKVARNDA